MTAERGGAAAPVDPIEALEIPHDGLLGRLIRLDIAVSQVLDQICQRSGVPAADYLVLGTIRRSPGGRTTPGEICQVLRRTSGGMTLTLDRLEASGWVTRSPDPVDRRRVAVELTPDGYALAKAINDDLHTWESSLGLSEPKARQVASALSELTAVIEA